MTNVVNLVYTPVPANCDTEPAYTGHSIDFGQMTWSAETVYTFDIFASQQIAMQMKCFRTMHFSNLSTGSTLVQIQGTNYLFRLPPTSFGVIKILAGERPHFTISNASGNSLTRIWLTDLVEDSFVYSSILT